MKNLEYNFIRNLCASVVPCRNSSFCKNVVGLSEKLFEDWRSRQVFFRADGIFSKNFGIYTEHLIFLVTFFIKEKSDKRQEKNSNQFRSKRVNLKDRA